jgi:decaprenylphospho-beta-D-ribofuranose 2-oxidase
VAGPLTIERLRELVLSHPAGGVAARGAGLSYGDAALNAGGYVLSPVTRPQIELTADAASVRATASVSFAELLSVTVPRGRILPVLPGTRNLTVGGAIAADVHGKNHRADGSIGAWIEEIELLDGSGDVRCLDPADDPAAFHATVGGMGLTGIILAATIRLVPIRSAFLDVTSRRLPDLDSVLEALDSARSRYAVAWLDTTGSGRSLGRGVIDEGDHLADPMPNREESGLAYQPARARRAPAVPFCPVTPWSAKAFNSLWFRKAPRHSSGVADLSSYFHRLDAVRGWNRALGPRGFVQYQFAVPDGAEHIITEVLEAVRSEHCAPFLGTLKRFGSCAGGHLSFPCRAGRWRSTCPRATRGSPRCFGGWTRR